MRGKSAWYFNLYTIPVVLSFVGLFFIFESSSVYALNTYADMFYFVKRQALWFGISLLGMVAFSRIHYRKLYIFALPIVVVGIVLLIGVLLPGVGAKINGARRWISLGIFSFQPAEIVKMSIVIYLAAWFQHKEKQRIAAFALLLLIILGLIMLQPDMGTAMVIATIAIGMYFLAGIDLKRLIIALPIFATLALVTAQSASYRLHRLRVLFDINADPQGIGYHVRQIMVAIQNGGLLGLGVGASKQKFLFLPEAHTDSIFAIVIEELGFIGAVGVMALYALLLYYLYRAVAQTKDRFGFMLGSGILLFFAVQSFVNLAAISRLLPLTGVPLPFISSGGTNLLISFCLLGIMQNIAKSTSDNAQVPSRVGSLLPLKREKKVKRATSRL